MASGGTPDLQRLLFLILDTLHLSLSFLSPACKPDSDLSSNASLFYEHYQ